MNVLNIDAIEKRMLELKLSQNALAHRMTMTQGHLSMVLAGKRNVTLEMLFTLAKALEVKVGDIMTDNYKKYL